MPRKKTPKAQKSDLIALVLMAGGVVIAVVGFSLVPLVLPENLTAPVSVACLVIGILIAMVGLKTLGRSRGKKSSSRKRK